MTTTGTNKQPMLVDRPLLEIVQVGAVAALTTPSNLNTPVPAGLTLLVSPGLSGCCIDSITAVATEASITASRIVIFASRIGNSALLTNVNAWCIGQADLVSSQIGSRTNIPLLPLLAPVPNLATPTAASIGLPGELDKKTTGLLIPSDWYLYAGASVVLQAGAQPARVNVIAQGGYY